MQYLKSLNFATSYHFKITENIKNSVPYFTSFQKLSLCYNLLPYFFFLIVIYQNITMAVAGTMSFLRVNCYVYALIYLEFMAYSSCCNP